MAQPPKCKNCGKTEWNHSCRGSSQGAHHIVHSHPEDGARLNAVDIRLAVLEKHLANVENRLTDLWAMTKPLQAPTEKRRAYMRDYMRKLRAKGARYDRGFDE